MTLVTLSGYIKVPKSDLDAVCDELPNHIALTREELGCLLFNVDVDPNDPCIFFVEEQFSEPTAFINHQARVRSSKWGTITRNVERHYVVTGMPKTD